MRRKEVGTVPFYRAGGWEKTFNMFLKFFSFTRTEGLSFPRRGKLKLVPSVPAIIAPQKSRATVLGTRCVLSTLICPNRQYDLENFFIYKNVIVSISWFKLNKATSPIRHGHKSPRNLVPRSLY